MGFAIAGMGKWAARAGLALALAAPLGAAMAQGAAPPLSGLVLATTDADWRQRWDVPASETPAFNQARKVRRGVDVFLLAFASGVSKDPDGASVLSCDARLRRPDGSVELERLGIPCFKAKISGAPDSLRLTSVLVRFNGDPGDPSGRWTFETSLRDQANGASVSLSTSFELE